MTPVRHNPVWAGLLALGSIYLAYSLLETLRSGVARGRGGFTHGRESDPVMFWGNIAVTGAMSVFLAFLAVRNF